MNDARWNVCRVSEDRRSPCQGGDVRSRKVALRTPRRHRKCFTGRLR